MNKNYMNKNQNSMKTRSTVMTFDALQMPLKSY